MNGYQSLTDAPYAGQRKKRSGLPLTRQTSISNFMHLKHQPKGGNLIPSPRGAPSPNQSANVETYAKFKARPFIEKNFLVKKSLKILTVPESFNLNT